MRTNLRSSARAMLRPSDVLPTPGGPTKHRMGVCSVRLGFAAAEAGGDGVGSVASSAGDVCGGSPTELSSLVACGEPGGEGGGDPATAGPADASADSFSAIFVIVRSRTA